MPSIHSYVTVYVYRLLQNADEFSGEEIFGPGPKLGQFARILRCPDVPRELGPYRGVRMYDDCM